MPNSSNTFPLNIVARQDASLAGTLKGIETAFDGAFANISAAGESALRRATRFDFSAARRDIDGLKQSLDGLSSQRATASADPFGIKASIAALKASPFQQVVNEQISAEASLAQQKARAAAEAVAGFERQRDAALAAIRDRVAAQTAAFTQAEQQGQALISLDKQRAAAMAQLAAAPSASGPSLYYDPSGAQASANAAARNAAQLNLVAEAAERVVATNGNATATQRAFATEAREAAGAAQTEADRLEALARAQAEVAREVDAAGAKLRRGGDDVKVSVGQQRQAFQQLGFQLNDVATQFSSGTPPLQIFAQQSGQVIQSLQLMTTKTTGLLGLLGGPFGAVLGAATVLLVPFVAKLFESGNAQQNAGAAATIHAEALKRLQEAVDRAANSAAVLNHNTRQGIADDLNAAEAARQHEIRVRGLLDAQLALAKGKLQAAKTTETTGAGQGSVPGGVALQATRDQASAAAEIAAIEGAQALNAVKLAKANQGIAAKSSALVLRDVAAATDKATAATQRFEDAQDSLTRKFERGGFGNVNSAAAQAAFRNASESLEVRKKAQLKAIEDAKSAASRSASAARATANRRAGEQRQELFANAQAVADGTDAIKAANSTYAATITKLRNDLREGLISADAATTAATRAREIRNAALDVAESGKKLDGALQQIGQQFDGDSSFVNRIQKAQAAVADAIKRLDPVTGTAQIGDHEYNREQLAGFNKNLDAEYLRPITDQNRALQEQAQINAAILAGHADEADFLRLKFGILQSYRDLSEEERAAIEAKIAPLRDVLALEYQREQAIQRRAQLIGVEVRAAQDLQAALTDALTAPFEKGSISRLADSFTKIRQRKVAEELSIKLFGDKGSEVYDALTRGSAPLKDAAVDLTASATALKAAATAIAARASNDNGPSLASVSATPSAYGLTGVGAAATIAASALKRDDDSGDIVVSGRRIAQQAITDGLAKIPVTLQGSGLPTLQGPQGLGSKISSFLDKNSTALTYVGQALGGKAGNVVAAYQNSGVFKGIGQDIAKSLGGSVGRTAGAAVAGAGTGLAADSVVRLLGGRGSTTGSAIGGALGGAVAGPLGAFVGGTLGSLIGGAFKKAQTGSATITSVGGSASLSGSSASYRAAANEQASAVQDSLSRIISALGATAGSFAVSIGQRDGKYVVDTNGTGSTKYGKANDGITAYKTEAEAQRAALLNAIQDGAVAGIREGAQRLLRAGTDLDRQLQKAVDFQSVFTQLKEYTDPVGAAIDALDKQFDYLRSVFAEASASSAEYADLEKLYGIKRTEAIKNAAQDATSTLQSLLDDLNFRGDNGLSLRTREANAKATFDPLAATVKAGGKVDQSAFADAAKAYLDIERQLYGSTSKYFDALSLTTGLTSQAIRNAGGVVTGSSSNDNAAIVQSANDNAAQLAQALYAQTQALQIPADAAALFTTADFSAAVAAGVATAATSPVSTAVVQPSNADVVAAIQAQTATMTAGFELVASATSSSRVSASSGSEILTALPLRSGALANA